MLDVGTDGDRHLGLPDHDERPAVAIAVVLPPHEVAEQLVAALALHDAADIEEQRAVDAEAVPEAVTRDVGGLLDADPDDLARHALVAEARVDHRALLLGVVRDGARRVEDAAVYGE